MSTLVVGVIGGGPRGLSAIESLCAQFAVLKNANQLHIELFEPLDLPGAGQVYVPDQSAQHWLNVPERLLNLPARPPCVINQCLVPSFVSYWDYQGINPHHWESERVDEYPTRGALGHYLADRFQTLAQALIKDGLLSWHHTEVVALQQDQDRWHITDSHNNTCLVNELAIAVGHQPTEPDEQMAKWLNHTKTHPRLVCQRDPFSMSWLEHKDSLPSGLSVGCRGFGLTMIDVMKNLTEGLGGSFQRTITQGHALTYRPSGREVEQIIPFSLDGLPLSPKPVSLAVDTYYTPGKTALAALGNTLDRLIRVASSQPLRTRLITAMSAFSAPVFMNLGDRARQHSFSQLQIEALCGQFFDEPQQIASHPLIDIDLPASEAIKSYLMMAYGASPVSLDYCLGQVWRHAQPTLYRTLSFRITDRDDIADVIALDEQMKRYAFGPPPASMERLLALEKAGIVSLDYVNDPEIETNGDQGWLVKRGDHQTTVQVMIDSVLDSTTVTNVSSPLFTQLREQELVKPVHQGLGVTVRHNSTVVIEEDAPYTPPIAVLGRLAQGSLVGVDAILECFGERQEAWASGVISRLSGAEVHG